MSRSEDHIQAEFPAGHVVGRYALREAVGQGGMGTVYAAFDETTNRNVAMKILADGIQPTLRERFLAECEAQAKIRHPNVMPVYDRAWLTEERPYFTMELLYAPLTLADIVAWTRDGSLSKRHPRLRHWAQPARLIQDVIIPAASGIAMANEQYRIQHRDIKPENILIDVRTRRAYVIDFGICRPIDELTDEGKIIGTPRFLSTEQARGKVDPRTDVWGIGALVHYVLTGEPPLLGSSPFSRRDVDDRIKALRQAERKAIDDGEESKARGYAERRRQLEDPEFRTLEDLYQDARDGNYLPLPDDVSPALAAVVHKAMAPTPSARYENVGALVEDLQAWISGGSVHALSEADTRGAAVDLARRTVARHLVTGVGITLALVVGTVLGRLVFQQPPLRPDHRARDSLADMDIVRSQVAAAAERTPGGELDPMTARTTWVRIQGRLDQLEARANVVADPDRGRALEDIAALRSALRPVPLEIRDSHAAWFVADALDPKRKPQPYESGETTLSPGLWRLERRGNPSASIPVIVPFVRHEAAPEPIRIDVPAFPEDAPDGMIWVPADPAGGNGAPHVGLLVQTRLVTCEQFGEFLDDLPPDQRRDHVPPSGFHQGDPSDSTRWLALPEHQMRPVAGLSVASVEAYARWRSDVHGFPLRVPTDAEWQHFAGLSWVDRQGSGRLLRYANSDTGPLDSPYGVHVRQTPSGRAEMVRADDGAYVVKTPDARPGTLPVPSAFRNAEAHADGAPCGFRLVTSLE